jgi:hypothetical protein
MLWVIAAGFGNRVVLSFAVRFFRCFSCVEYPSHSIPNCLHLWQAGFSSSHFTWRILKLITIRGRKVERKWGPLMVLLAGLTTGSRMFSACSASFVRRDRFPWHVEETEVDLRTLTVDMQIPTLNSEEV